MPLTVFPFPTDQKQQQKGEKMRAHRGGLNLNVRRVLLEEQVAGLEENQKRRDEVGHPTQLESYGFMILLCFTAEHQCDSNRLTPQNCKIS